MGKVTGSSIMPQKKNPDVLELVRANASVVYSMLFQTFELLKALPFGYNRDSRETKEAVVVALKRTGDSLTQMRRVLANMSVNRERMLQAVLDNYSLATDLADHLAYRFRLPYRLAYTIVGRVVDTAIREGKKLDQVAASALVEVAHQCGVSLSLTQAELQDILDPLKCIEKRKHIGGAGPEEMARLIERRSRQVQEHNERVMAQLKKIEPIWK
jgi:argininosuccinate lyase